MSRLIWLSAGGLEGRSWITVLGIDWIHTKPIYERLLRWDRSAETPIQPSRPDARGALGARTERRDPGQPGETGES